MFDFFNKSSSDTSKVSQPSASVSSKELEMLEKQREYLKSAILSLITLYQGDGKDVKTGGAKKAKSKSKSKSKKLSKKLIKKSKSKGGARKSKSKSLAKKSKSKKSLVRKRLVKKSKGGARKSKPIVRSKKLKSKALVKSRVSRK